MATSTPNAPIFVKLRAQNMIPAEDYERLGKVMRKLGYSDFLTYEQGLITLNFLKGESVFGVLPTAGGKSFTFQTVARMTEGLTIVISPLIALMKNLVGKFRDGASLYFNSDLSPWEKKEVKRRIREGKVKFLYVSPERLKSTDFKELLNTGRQRVKRLVIDEAHCVVEWGYGFRVKYLHIAQEIDAFEKRVGHTIPVLLLTATASPWLQRETVKNLQIEIPRQNFITQKDGADRPELKIKLQAAKDDRAKIRWLAKQLTRGGRYYGQRGIIFSAFADGGEGLNAMNAPKLRDELQELGVRPLDCYHGGMRLDERRMIQRDFENGKLKVLIATKAFGMGIDLPKLDFVVHFYPPLSLEEYWQEAGRGGRGMNPKKGEYCECTILHNQSDYDRLEGFHSSAGLGKTLSTFTTVASGEIYINRGTIKPGGALRKLLKELHRRKDLRAMPQIRVGGITLERWKLRKSASTVVKHIESLFLSKDIKKTKQTRRVRNVLRIRAARKGKTIRVKQGSKFSGPALDYYNLELNWFTEPDIGALAMIDDEVDQSTVYTRFRLLKERLSKAEMRSLARKIKDFRTGGQAKLDFVFDEFLTARRSDAKAKILQYLAGP